MGKKTILLRAAGAMLLCIGFGYFFGMGLMKNGSTYIGSYSLSADGTEMTIQVGVSSSAGYVRKVQAAQQQGGTLYLDCYRAFGGINGSMGAQSSYTIPLEEDTKIIALYRSKDCYEEVLRKDPYGQWQTVQ